MVGGRGSRERKWGFAATPLPLPLVFFLGVSPPSCRCRHGEDGDGRVRAFDAERFGGAGRKRGPLGYEGASKGACVLLLDWTYHGADLGPIIQGILGE